MWFLFRYFHNNLIHLYVTRISYVLKWRIHSGVFTLTWVVNVLVGSVENAHILSLHPHVGAKIVGIPSLVWCNGVVVPIQSIVVEYTTAYWGSYCMPIVIILLHGRRILWSYLLVTWWRPLLVGCRTVIYRWSLSGSFLQRGVLWFFETLVLNNCSLLKQTSSFSFIETFGVCHAPTTFLDIVR